MTAVSNVKELIDSSETYKQDRRTGKFYLRYYYWMFCNFSTMDNCLIQYQEKNEQEAVIRVPVCSANLTSPVFDTANYIGQVHYKIGTRLYIKNAD